MSKFKIMTWNVQVLSRTELAASDYRNKIEQLAGVLRQHKPDLIALQEVVGEGPLKDLQESLGVLYPHRALCGIADSKNFAVAFLSQKPLVALDSDLSKPIQDGQPESGSRGALHALLKVGGRELNVVTAHLKSKLLTFPGNRFTTEDEDERARVAGAAVLRRTREAVNLRRLATRILTDAPEAGLVLLGDLNDGPEAATTQLIYGPPGSQPESDSPAAFNSKDRGDAQRLFNVTLSVPKERRFSRLYRNRPELIDHILVSHQLLPLEEGRRQLPLVDCLVEVAASIGDNPNEKSDAAPSDHAPVVASFDI